MAADVIQAPKTGASNHARRHTRAVRHDDHQSLLLFCYRRPGRRDFRFHSIEIEACALLHWREFDRSHGQLLHLVLDEHEAPEFVLEPVKVLLRPVADGRKLPSWFSWLFVGPLWVRRRRPPTTHPI